MGLLDSFEKGLERAVNSAFAKTFRSGIQPVEIASALRSELDKKAAVVSRDRILVPNSFVVRLAPADHERMQALGATLGDELLKLIKAHAESQGYSFASEPVVQLRYDESVSTGVLRVDSSAVENKVTWQGVVDVEGKRHVLVNSRTVIGRGSDATITISDAGTSRRHVEILWDSERAMVRDLGSTNGTTLNGNKVTQASLPPDSTITIGRTKIVFRVIPRAARPTLASEDATRAFNLHEGGSY